MFKSDNPHLSTNLCRHKSLPTTDRAVLTGATLKPRLHQGNMLSGNKLLVRATCCLYLGNIITIHLYEYTTCIPLFPATNWQQFFCHQHVSCSNMLTACWRQQATCCPAVNAALGCVVSVVGEAKQRLIEIFSGLHQLFVSRSQSNLHGVYCSVRLFSLLIWRAEMTVYYYY